MIYRNLLLLVGSITFIMGLTSAARAEYALRDKDTVIFLGDSITAARTYGKIIENYTLLRFPERKVRFINAGWGGDTAAGGLAPMPCLSHFSVMGASRRLLFKFRLIVLVSPRERPGNRAGFARGRAVRLRPPAVGGHRNPI